jgi:hypothetical protein
MINFSSMYLKPIYNHANSSGILPNQSNTGAKWVLAIGGSAWCISWSIRLDFNLGDGCKCHRTPRGISYWFILQGLLVVLSVTKREIIGIRFAINIFFLSVVLGFLCSMQCCCLYSNRKARKKTTNYVKSIEIHNDWHIWLISDANELTAMSTIQKKNIRWK